MNPKPMTIALLAAGALAAAPSIAGNRMTRSAYGAEKQRIDAEYRVEAQRCSSLAGNARDVCMVEAKGRQTAGKADAHAAFRGTDAAAADALVAHADADYAVAKEKCDDLAGDPRDACMKEAKAAHARAKADAKERFGKS